MIQDQIPLLPGETWEDIPGYEGIYSVSNLGRVKRKRRIIYRRNSNKPYEITESILHQSYDRPDRVEGNRYYVTTLGSKSKPRCCYVHRLVAEALIPNLDNLPLR